MNNPFVLALLGTGMTFTATVLGSALVFFFKGDINPKMQRVFLGFAAGVMIAASIWSLIIPSMHLAKEQGFIEWVPTAIGFILGALFLLLLDKLMPHLHLDMDKPEGMRSSMRRTTMLFFAVTLHNIPEGMAVGLAFSLAAEGNNAINLASALGLAVGMGIQNFPEGSALSLPLKKEGFSNKKAFLYGSASGVVEPIFGILSVLLISFITPLMPWLLAFAAGAMIYVVVEELIPSAHLGEHSNAGTIGVMAGFLIMMILDVAFSS